MNTINMSPRKFANLDYLPISNRVFNTEAAIYEFKYKNEDKVLKSLFNLSGPTFANKLYTLEMLSTYQEYLPETFCVPDYLISVKNKVVGFTIPKFNGLVLTDVLNNRDVSIEEKKFYLKKVGEILEQLKNIRAYTPLNDFYLNDLHESNFLVNPCNKEMAVVDLDSSKIMGNMPYPSRFLTTSSLANLVPDKYIISNKPNFLGLIEASEETDLFCYSIMILNYLCGRNVSSFSIEDFYHYLTYLRTLGVNQELIDIFSNLIVNSKNKNPAYYIDSLTEEQIWRANDAIYEKVRK